MTTTASGTSLHVSDLHKEYPTPAGPADPLVVLRGISLALSAGEALAVIGPSGSGKSTLLHILGTLDRPTRGEVRLNGSDIFALDANGLARVRSEHIGFIFQDHHLLPQCTALENVLMARLASGKVTAEAVARGEELLRQVGLAERLTHLPSELSGGERQRVAVARAMMNRPNLLLCDEPTGNLDAKTSHVIGELLRGLAAASQAMLIIVTHSQELAALLPRRMRMVEGRLIDT